MDAILGYARMLRSGWMTGEKHMRAVEAVERNATALTQIVEDVLDVSRIVAGKIRLNIQPLERGFQLHLAKPVDPTELVVAIASLVRRTRVS